MVCVAVGAAAKDPAPRRGGAKARALEHVKERILTGGFRGGDLISEGEVAAALGMSRTPVREAFLRLEAEGLLRLYPQRGALVVPVSPEEVRAVMEARLVIEQFAARSVCRAPAPARAVIADALDVQWDRQRAAGGDLRGVLDADRAFHTVLVEAAGNPILADVYSSLRDRQLRMIGESAVRDPRRTATIVDEHSRIAVAVREGDTDALLDAVRAHLTGTVRALGLAVDALGSLAAD
ncbi:GntR family transcriptional regulator [Pseudonocardia sp.]|uniref:GntR family transcriptional regulator n=1 Tax=Pseudonocardia sp. TaxID=60912 RepID=UPI003D0C5925